MRLLNTATFALKEFVGHDIPRYAILSHRWEDEEVTLQDLQNAHAVHSAAEEFGDGGTPLFKSKGWCKVRGCCSQGAKDGFDWVWIDTCCIDKSSSAELTEAINSMFNWYQDADICYVYLSDVSGIVTEGNTHSVASEFCRSKWFTRGWTLQELLAPSDVAFFNSVWESIGSKASLGALISQTTGIRDLDGYMEACIAQKMSWASKRNTTRVEDRAYSLMGLLGVNMPPLYGEGQKAFLRLQLEILKLSDDESIFAWHRPQNDMIEHGGLLASSPDPFELSGDIYELDSQTDRPAYQMTNKGLRIESHALVAEDPESLMEDRRVDDTFLVPLQCALRKVKATEQRLALHLRRLDGDQYGRITCSDFILMSPDQQKAYKEEEQNGTREVFLVKQYGMEGGNWPFLGPYSFSIKISTLSSLGVDFFQHSSLYFQPQTSSMGAR